MMETVGWISSILFAICAAPQAYHSYKAGNAEGVSSFFLWTWFIGEALGVAYAVHLGSLPLIFNYLANMSALLVILKYKYLPRK